MVLFILSYGGYGEVVNTLDCGSNIRGFDSHYPLHLDNKRTVYEIYKVINQFFFYILFTNCLNFSPLSAKFLNISKLALAGENNTTSFF